MRAYSIDLRERIVRSVQAGRSQSETARVFGIGLSTVKRFLQQQREHGSLAPKPIPGAARHIGPEQEEALRAQFQAHSDATLEQHSARWEQDHDQRVSVATMSRALARLRWTQKKVTPSLRTQRDGPHSLARGSKSSGGPADGLCG